MRDLTLVLPYFMNAGMWLEQQRIFADYPADQRGHLHVVVVDDCSPRAEQVGRTSVTINGLASLRIYRLLEKKRWNWLACRNLGAKVATTDWLLLTDIDHGIPPATLTRLLTGELDPQSAYRFSRVNAPHPWPYRLKHCERYKAHNDTWLLTRQLFFHERVFGYDERLSGCYGTSGEFKDRVFSTARAHVHLPDVIIRYPREVIPDASTHPTMYTRKNDPENHEELTRRKAERALIPDWKPLHGLTPYEEIYSSMAVKAVA